MKEKLKQQYDSLYSSENSLYGSDKAIKLARSLCGYLPKGKVLDIGGGEGRNALYLAKQGYTVSVVDLSVVGIKNLLLAAKQVRVKVDTKVADITEVGIEENYDAIMMSFVLHHMDTEEAVRLIKDSQQHTNKSGIHMIATFANSGELFKRNEFKKRFYPDPDKLKQMYAGWKVLLFNVGESTSRAKDKDGNRLKNDVVRLMVQKTE